MRDEKHVLPERLKPGLRLVFCGTAAGRQSALQKAYYAHSQNKFWRTLHDVGLTPHQFAPRDYPALWDLGIGLTDIAKFSYGMDHQLPRHSLGRDAADALRARDPQDRTALPGFHQPHRRTGGARKECGDGQTGREDRRNHRLGSAIAITARK